MADYTLPGDWRLRIVPRALSEVVDWGQTWLGVDKLWGKTRGKGVRIAVLDTGCDVNHPDLDGAIDDAQDFTGSAFGPMDVQGHGTWCAGYVGARANDIGVKGVANECRLLIGKVLGDGGSGSDQGILHGIQWADDHDADIISMSLGGPTPMEAVRGAIIAFCNKRPGRFVFCAAGNDGHKRDTVGYPGRYPEVVSVAAVDRNGQLTSWSSYNEQVTIAGPGLEMLSTIPTTQGSYGVMSGTSMATPCLAAVGALALSYHRDNVSRTPLDTTQQMKDHLRISAKKINGVPVVQPVALIALDEQGAPGGQPARDFVLATVTALLTALGYDCHSPAVAGDQLGVSRHASTGTGGGSAVGGAGE